MVFNDTNKILTLTKTGLFVKTFLKICLNTAI